HRDQPSRLLGPDGVSHLCSHRLSSLWSSVLATTAGELSFARRRTVAIHNLRYRWNIWQHCGRIVYGGTMCSERPCDAPRGLRSVATEVAITLQVPRRRYGCLHERDAPSRGRRRPAPSLPTGSRTFSRGPFPH